MNFRENIAQFREFSVRIDLNRLDYCIGGNIFLLHHRSLTDPRNWFVQSSVNIIVYELLDLFFRYLPILQGVQGPWY